MTSDERICLGTAVMVAVNFIGPFVILFFAAVSMMIGEITTPITGVAVFVILITAGYKAVKSILDRILPF